jgi:hypothetical protein
VPAPHGQGKVNNCAACVRGSHPSTSSGQAPFAKDAKDGARTLFLVDGKSKSPPCPCKNRRDKDGAPALVCRSVRGLKPASFWKAFTALKRRSSTALFQGGVGFRMPRARVPALHGQDQWQGQGQQRCCGRSWFPPFDKLRAGSFAKDGKDGARSLLLDDLTAVKAEQHRKFRASIRAVQV